MSRGQGLLWVLGALVMGIALSGCDKGKGESTGSIVESTGSIVGEWIPDFVYYSGPDIGISFKPDGKFVLIIKKSIKSYILTGSWTQVNDLIAMKFVEEYLIKGNQKNFVYQLDKDKLQFDIGIEDSRVTYEMRGVRSIRIPPFTVNVKLKRK